MAASSFSIACPDSKHHLLLARLCIVPERLSGVYPRAHFGTMSSSKDEKPAPQAAQVAGPTFGIRRSRWARIALVATAAVTYWAVRLHHGFYQDGSHTRTTYALCAHDPDGLYTVDVSDSVTQCMVVKDTFLADTGSLSGPPCSHDKIVDSHPSCTTEAVRSRWPGIHITITPKGSMILPGMTGWYSLDSSCT